MVLFVWRHLLIHAYSALIFFCTYRELDDVRTEWNNDCVVSEAM